MKKIVIAGGGTAGTMMAHHLNKRLDLKEWEVTLVDPEKEHYYQPGFLFIPFGIYGMDDVIKRKENLLPRNTKLVEERIDEITPETNRIKLQNGTTLDYDILIIATGTNIVPDETEGLTGHGWRKEIFDFYTPEGARALFDALGKFDGGDLVVHITEMPIKCPVAPLEFAFLADWYLQRRGIRQKTNLTYVTPLEGAFTKPLTSKLMGKAFEAKKINLVGEFNIERVDPDTKRIVSFDEREVPYDLLVTIPVNMGDEAIRRSGFGDELNYVPTDHHTLQSKVKENIFVIGDATDIPASKAGAVAHFEADVLIENLLRYIKGEELKSDFDGHATCFIESGFNKGFLIDFNYDYEPAPGKFPLPGIGPFSLLKENWINHAGKLAFKWVYWNLLLKARKMPTVTTKMSLAGKKFTA